MAEVKLADIIVDCVDAMEMQKFYMGLLGWKAAEFFGNPAVKSENEVMIVFIAEEEEGLYTPPIWPDEKEKQQKQIHFDFVVSDLAVAVEKAMELGAKKAEAQYGGDIFVTLFDPAGHPFCLVQE
ncbi:MAG: VOC family protein [Christensenellaceae bacterium]|jgi:predicted enzyme related to lactoylglutathione lyase